jgi:hypothetical protein
MTNKSRIKDDAFGWVDEVIEPEQTVAQPKPTPTKRATSRKTVKTKSASAKAKSEAVTHKSQRLVVIAYKNENGDIMASQELTFDSQGNGNISWSGISKDMTVKVFKLIGELADKEIIEIHRNYKVSPSGTLELKQWE